MNKLEPIVKRSLDDWKLYCDQIANNTAVNFNENKADQELRKTRALKDYNFFVKTYFPHLAKADCGDFHIDAAKNILKMASRINILEWPREHAKSVHADIMIPMWLNIHGDLTGMILMGKNSIDANNLLSDVQAELMKNELYIHDWGEQYNFGDWQEGNFTTKKGIRFIAIGRDQSPRGARKGALRPNYAVIDDVDDDELVNNQKRVKAIIKRLLGALLFALDTKKWRMVVAGNRIHSQSVLAHMVGDIKPNAPKRKNIYHSKIFAIDPATGFPAWHQNYTLAQLQAKIEAAGPTEARRELFHENHVEGTIFKDTHIQWKKMPKVNWKNYTVIIGYCDPSFENKETSDFKAVRVWGLWQAEKHCLKAFVQRIDMISVFNFMSDFEDKLPPGVAVIWYIEQQFFNRPIRQDLADHNKMRKDLKMPLLHITIDTRTKPNKYTRIVRMEPDYTLRKVYYNIDEIHNGDMIEGNNQLKGIEPGYNSPDDSPDADEGAWHYLDMHTPDRINAEARVGEKTRDRNNQNGYISTNNKKQSW